MATIQKRGNSWRAMVRRQGHKFDGTFDTEEEARTWADRKEAAILAGKVHVVRPADITTIPSLMTRYAREVSPDKGGARWERIRLAALERDPDLQGLAAAADGGMMAKWRDRRLGEVSAATVNRELNLISAVFTRAMKEWRLPLPANPVHQIQRPKQPRNRTRRVSEAERADIIKALCWDGSSPPTELRQWIAWGFSFALETMMRQGEILRLTWQHVHTERKFCHLPKTKNGHSRNVPLSSRALSLLALLPEGNPDHRVVPVSSGTFGAYFRDAVRDAGIEDLHFHDTRREALTRASQKLSNVAELARASGHRGVRSLLIYYEPDATDLADKLG